MVLVCKSGLAELWNCSVRGVLLAMHINSEIRFKPYTVKVNIPGILATLVYISSNISYICHVWHHMTLTIDKEE